MILPTTYAIALLLAVLTFVFLGSWANTFKLAGPKWRFELYYFDFAAGVLIAAMVAAFTYGSMGDELSFVDNIMITGKRNLAFAIAAGGIFNLANILMVAAIVIAGMSVAFPIVFGISALVATAFGFIIQKQSLSVEFFVGRALLLIAVVLGALAYRALTASKLAAAKAEPAPEMAARASKVKHVRPPGAAKGIVVAVVAGILMGSFYPLVVMAQAPGTDYGLGPYSMIVFLSLGIFFSTFVYNIYFINLPIHGEAVEFGAYLKGSFRQHILGVLGGVLWTTGALMSLIVASAAGGARVEPVLSYLAGQAAPLLAALWGLLAWREFRGAGSKPAVLILLTITAYAAGLAVIALAPRVN